MTKKQTKLMLGDNIESLRKLPDNSVDSIVTDPPYGLSFMNKKWDHDVPSIEFWREVYRVLKPGGHILSFGGTRTYHRMVVNIEDAGFEIRDQIMWLYGSGFPKSHNIGKAIDKLQGNDREVIGTKNDFALDGRVRKPDTHKPMNETINSEQEYGYKQGWDTPVTKGQSPYEGWGTALKPANEPICVARKPISEKSVAENVLKWGTGGINIDGCRVGSEGGTKAINFGDNIGNVYGGGKGKPSNQIENINEGRFPANIILDEIAGELLDEQSGYLKSGEVKPHHKKNKTANGYQGSCYGKFQNEDTTLKGYGDGGGASRFFYQAKVSKKERNMGLDEFEDKVIEGRDSGQDERSVAYKKRPTPTKNTHPTVKPVSLMAYLCRLVTPPNGIVLDPFMGSGSTGIAAQLEGFRFCGMEMDGDYFKIAEARIENYEQYKKFIK
jgi:site-specific DNA-methyltransferase (adenine-specific)